MKTILLALFSLLLVSGLCRAEITVGPVSRERAKELGIEMRVKGDGPEVWVEMEFKAEGELKEFLHVSMEIRDDKKLLVGWAPLQAQPAEDKRVHVRFMANRAFLEKITLRVMTGRSLSRIGHDLAVKDFMDKAR